VSEDLLARLQAATSDEERQWLALQFRIDTLPAEVREALWAAAVPHWFDTAILAALLDQPRREAARIFEALKTLPWVEGFPKRGHNIHDRTRRMLLGHLWRDDRPRYTRLSRRASDYCRGQDPGDLAWHIERIYHLVIGVPERGLKMFADAALEWSNRFSYERIEALVRLVREHVDGGRVDPQAVTPVLFWDAQVDKVYSRNAAAAAKLQQVRAARDTDPWMLANTIQSLGDVYLQLDEYREARARFEEALALYTQLGDSHGAANCIQSLGTVHRMLDEYDDARARYQEALPLFRQIGSRQGEANTISSLGDMHLQVAEYDAAQARYEEALALYRELEDEQGEANCIQSLGDLYRMRDEYSEARLRYEQALPIYRQLRNRVGEANCISALGVVHRMLDEYPEARARYEEALPLYREIGNRLGEANCISALGDVHLELDEVDEARARYEEALALYRQIGDRLGQASRIRSLGDIDRVHDRPDAARARYDEALALFRQIGYRLGEANCIRSLGDLLALLGESAQARAHYEEALELFRQIGDRLSEAGCRESLGDLHALLGEADAARAHYEQALALYRHIRLRSSEARVLGELGQVYGDLGRLDEAVQAYQQALALTPDLAYLHNNIADAYLEQGDFEPAREHYGERIRLDPGTALNAVVSLGVIARHQGAGDSADDFQRALDLWDSARAAGRESQTGLMTNRALALLGLGQPEAALAALREALAAREPDDTVSPRRFELLKSAPRPPEGVDALIALLQAPADDAAAASGDSSSVRD
jgi:tetratricopeptide (TPR) repeat protein